MKKPIETIFKEEAQRVFDCFSDCFDIRIIFYTPDGKISRVGQNQPNCKYCCLLQDKLYGVEKCRSLDEIKLQEAAEKRKLIHYTCHAGLTEAVKPLYHQGRLLGFSAMGQLRTVESPPEEVIKDWHKKYNTNELMEAYNSIPLISNKRFDSILELFSSLLDYIVSQRMISLRENSNLQEILAFLESNIHRDLSLSETAQAIGKSKSTITHLLKRELGKSFKATLIEMKIKKAEELLESGASKTIQHAASQVGYIDPLYFSRLYKKYRGYPPIKHKREA